MNRGRHSSNFAVAAAIVLALLAPASSAWAATVQGTVKLPDDADSGRRFPGYWRVDNGNVPVKSAASEPDAVVVLEDVQGQAPAPRTITVEIAGMKATPALLVVGEGSVIEFKNNDAVFHDLSTPASPTLMPLQRLRPGSLRRQKFPQVGGYLVRAADHPHISISVIVVNAPYHATVDRKGGFKIEDVPEGKAKLRVWLAGRWVHTQEVDVGRGGNLKIDLAAATVAAE